MKKSKNWIFQAIIIVGFSTFIMFSISITRKILTGYFDFLYFNYEILIFGIFAPLFENVFFVVPNFFGSIVGLYLLREESTRLKKYMIAILSASIVFGVFILMNSIPIMLIGYKKGPIMIKALLPEATINSIVFIIVFVAVKCLFSKSNATEFQ